MESKNGDSRINIVDTIEPSIQQQVKTQEKQEGKHFDYLITVTDAELLKNLNARNDKENYQERKKIQRVPEILKRNEDFKEYYKPMELSVGPLHAIDPKLFKLELKIKLARRFFNKSCKNEADLFKEIKDNLQDLKTFYDDKEFHHSDDTLARLLFLDGCAVLQLIHSFDDVNQSLNEFSINNGQADLIKQDLLLLENQIPFKVLTLLMDLKFENENENENKNKNKTINAYVIRIVEFILDNNPIEMDYPTSQRASNFLTELICSRGTSVNHLLELLQSLLVMQEKDSDFGLCAHDFSFWEWVCILCCPWIICVQCCPFDACEYFLDYILSFFYDYWYPQQSFRNVQELKAAGITLKPKDTHYLTDISFHKQWFFRGRVELPRLIVDGSTARKMLNLVAYEMCLPNYQQECYVTSYINLIDLLIDDEKDVKLLRSADILRNRLSSDAEVATLFNKIGSTCLSPPKDKYEEVKNSIENHYKRKLAVWMAQAYHNHCSSPWAIVALLAALAVLLLTAIQTWYAIYPNK